MKNNLRYLLIALVVAISEGSPTLTRDDLTVEFACDKRELGFDAQDLEAQQHFVRHTLDFLTDRSMEGFYRGLFEWAWIKDINRASHSDNSAICSCIIGESGALLDRYYLFYFRKKSDSHIVITRINKESIKDLASRVMIFYDDSMNVSKLSSQAVKCALYLESHQDLSTVAQIVEGFWWTVTSNPGTMPRRYALYTNAETYNYYLGHILAREHV